MSTKKIAVFVDLISQFQSVHSFYRGQKIDYFRYLEQIETEGEIYKSIAYGAAVDNEANSFIKALNNLGFETKYVPAKIINGRPTVKFTNRTMDMVVDIIKMMDRIDTVVIGSNNLDLVPFLAYLKEKGITVILFACNIPNELRKVCDRYWFVDNNYLEIPKEYEEVENVKSETT